MKTAPLYKIFILTILKTICKVNEVESYHETDSGHVLPADPSHVPPADPEIESFDQNELDTIERVTEQQLGTEGVLERAETAAEIMEERQEVVPENIENIEH